MSQQCAKLRHVRLHPYKRGHGPVFGLTLYDTGFKAFPNHHVLGYRLTQDGKVVFAGDDFKTPFTPLDSDHNVEEVLGHLVQVVDEKACSGYTREQVEFSRQHAEWLACEAERRFGSK